MPFLRHTLLSLCLAAATSGLAAADNTAAAAPTAPAADSRAATAAGKVARGLILQSQERLIFTPCRDRNYVNIEDLSPNAEVTTQLKALGLAEGTPIYAEVFGEAEGNGILRMRALNFASLDARCYAPRRSTGEWRAAGKDWSLTLFENQGTLQQSNQPDISGEYAVNAQDDNSVNIALGGQLNAPLRLKRQHCRSTGDSGKPRLQAWHAELTVNGKKYEGCAWRQ